MENLQNTLEKIIRFDEEYNTQINVNYESEQLIVVDTNFVYDGKKYYICQQAKNSPMGSQYAMSIYIDNQETNYDVFYIRSLEDEINKKASKD